MKEITGEIFKGERSLFMADGVKISTSVFEDGESPLKEGRDIYLDNCVFRWYYPLWYCENVVMKGGLLAPTARAGIWYTKNLRMYDTVIEAPKTLRRSENITLGNINFPNAEETLWHCKDITAEHVTAAGDYFAMGASDACFSHLTLTGKYSFDGVENVVIKNSRLLSKDAFWNSKNVRVENSFISGEYLGWNSENLSLVGCTVESHQGLCYAKNLKMENCRIINTDLAFEYSTVDATLSGRVESIKNPLSGTIRVEAVGEIILEEDKINPADTRIIKG